MFWGIAGMEIRTLPVKTLITELQPQGKMIFEVPLQDLWYIILALYR